MKKEDIIWLKYIGNFITLVGVVSALFAHITGAFFDINDIGIIGFFYVVLFIAVYFEFISTNNIAKGNTSNYGGKKILSIVILLIGISFEVLLNKNTEYGSGWILNNAYIIGIGIFIDLISYMGLKGKTEITQTPSNNSTIPSQDNNKSIRQDSEELLQEKVNKLLKLAKITTRIKIDDAIRMMGVTREELLILLLNNAENLPGCKIDGDFIVVNEQSLQEFSKLLNAQFEDWKVNEKTKEGKN